MRSTALTRRLVALAAAASLVLVLGVPHVAAAGIVVNTLADSDANDGSCSLREAIEAANLDAASGAAAGECAAGSGADTITFTTSGTIALGADMAAIRDDVTIDGAGVITVDGVDSYRPFTIIDGASVVLEELVITRGSSTTAGGNIYVAQLPTELTIVRSVVREGTANDGGGVWNNSGALTVIDSTLAANTASTGSGGAIHNRFGGTLTMTGSTLQGNAACARGGGLWNTGDATMTNSTVSGNAVGGCAAPSGGGVFSEVGAIDLVNVTVANNTGGGVAATTGTTSIANSVLAGNAPSDCAGVGLDGGNVVSDASCASPDVTDLVSTDPLLGSLASNGGPTLTHALLPGSPAIDAAVGCPPPTVDQRGEPRDDGACDAGAFEAQGSEPTPTPTPSPTATATAAASPSPTGGVDPTATSALTVPPTTTDRTGDGQSSSSAVLPVLVGVMLAALLLAPRRTRRPARR